MSISVDTIVAFALRHSSVMDALGEALRSDLVVANPYHRILCEHADDFLSRYRKLPGEGDWVVWLETLPFDQQAGCREALGRLSSIVLDGYEPEYFAEKVLPELKKAAATNALARLNTLQEVPPEALSQISEQVQSIATRSITGLADLRDIDIWARPTREEDIIPTGYPLLDKAIGGWGRELWMILADAKAGKSMLLQNCAANMARSGATVLHVTLELGLKPQILRYYRQLSQATRADFTNQIDQVRSNLQHWFRFAKGNVYLIEFPAYSLTTDELRRVIDRVTRKVGKVDALILDYLDLMTLPAGVRAGRGYEDLGRITHEVRAYCPQFELSVLTATQAVRRPEKAGRLTAKDMGDSYNKVRGADGILGLVQTPEEEKLHQGRLGIIMARDSAGGDEIPLYINRELSLIQQLDHPNTRALMAQLGHLLPTVPATP